MTMQMRSDVEKIVGKALDSASPASVIEGMTEPSVFMLKTRDDRTLKISTPNPKSSSRAELVLGGETIDPAPSGTFKLANGKTLTIENGRLTGGTAASGESMRDWAVFALLPEG